MSTLTVLLYALVVVISLLLIGIILVQPSKSGGLGATFGGIGESVFGAQAGSHLTRATVVMTAIFFLLTLILASLIGHGVKLDNRDRGVMEQLETGSESSAAAAAAVPAAAVPESETAAQ